MQSLTTETSAKCQSDDMFDRCMDVLKCHKCSRGPIKLLIDEEGNVTKAVHRRIWKSKSRCNHLFCEECVFTGYPDPKYPSPLWCKDCGDMVILSFDEFVDENKYMRLSISLYNQKHNL